MRSEKNDPTCRRRGAVLIFVLIAIVLIGAFAGNAATGLFRERREMEYALHKTQFEMLAEDVARRGETGTLIVDRELLRLPRDVRIETVKNTQNGSEPQRIRVAFDPPDPPLLLCVEKVSK